MAAAKYPDGKICWVLTRSIRDSETSIDFVQGPPGSCRERVKSMAVFSCGLLSTDKVETVHHLLGPESCYCCTELIAIVPFLFSTMWSNYDCVCSWTL